jgi:formate dehydrogenase major subunit
MEGSFTNTQRLLQWHHKAADPPGDARSDIWFTIHLGLRLKELYQTSPHPRNNGIQALVWDYIDAAENARWRIKDEPSASLILQEVNGYFTNTRKLVQGFGDLKDDGSTACGCWIYSGVFAPDDKHPDGFNRAASREKGRWISPQWGFAWPANRHMMYNRASADPAGNPWPKEARLAQAFNQGTGGKARGFIWWDPEAETRDAQGNLIKGQWVGIEGEVPDFPLTKPPTAQPKPGGVGLDFHSGADPFIMKADGKAWLYAPSGLADGPLPTHYEPAESPVENLLYKQQNNPVYKRYDVPGNELAKVGDPAYPYILSTYRLTEHHLSGSMSRWLPWLAELQPELFIEISPELAKEKGIINTQRVKVSTPRGTIRAKALVTKRIRPFNINGKVVHQVGMPWHWGYKGIAVGDVVNDLTAMVGDPNVTIHEAKVFVCSVEPA